MKVVGQTTEQTSSLPEPTAAGPLDVEAIEDAITLLGSGYVKGTMPPGEPDETIGRLDAIAARLAATEQVASGPVASPRDDLAPSGFAETRSLAAALARASDGTRVQMDVAEARALLRAALADADGSLQDAGSPAAESEPDEAYSRHLVRGCECPQWPHCVPHGATEWGGGEPETCIPHEHASEYAPTAREDRGDASRLAAALRPWLRHYVWCNCKTDDLPNEPRCKCGLRAALRAEQATDEENR